MFSPAEETVKAVQQWLTSVHGGRSPHLSLVINSSGELVHCDVLITPACIRALYGVPKDLEYPDVVPRPDNSLAIFEGGDYYAQQDLDLFCCEFLF